MSEPSYRTSLPLLQGHVYYVVLQWLHATLQPKTYLEIGTLFGDTLRLSSAASLAIDPEFQLNADVVGKKPLCGLYQLTSDRFFAQHSARTILGGPVELAFLDGMHRCEFLLRDFANVEREAVPNAVIAMHDCVPIEAPMTNRDGPGTAIDPERQGWWTGDVWRTVLALKRFRPDLRILTLDAPPTGIVLVTGLDPASTMLRDRYWEIVDNMMAWSLEGQGLERLYAELPVQSTSLIDTPEKLTVRFWL